MSDLEIFNQFNGEIRKVWDEGTDEWWYAIVDVVELLTESPDPSKYLYKMKKKEPDLEHSPFWRKFTMISKKNNRKYQTDCFNQKGILRIIQSIPSPNVEPLKRWLAITGSRRLDEIALDPLELEREKYRLQGYDEDWIDRRLKTKAQRNALTDEWSARNVEGKKYGILTNEIHKGAFDGMTVQDHKELKGVEKANLRDHMSPYELLFTELGEMATTEQAQATNAQGFKENLEAAQSGGENAGAARKTFEKMQGISIISDKSYIEERKRLLAHGTVGKCESCHSSIKESETYGTEVGNLCQSCFAIVLNRGEINEDGEVI
jgi:DNA-damage-inducible protein D